MMHGQKNIKLCTVLFPPGVNPIVVNKCIISISYNFHTLVSCNLGNDFLVNIFWRSDQFHLLRAHVSLFACACKCKEERKCPYCHYVSIL